MGARKPALSATLQENRIRVASCAAKSPRRAVPARRRLVRDHAMASLDGSLQRTGSCHHRATGQYTDSSVFEHFGGPAICNHGAPVIERPVEDFFRDVRADWLYDEIDLISPGVFSHSILLSNGLVITIQFRDFRYHIAPLLDPG